MIECPRFFSCDAPLCPLDPELFHRTWYVGEDIFASRTHGKVRWIRKQRSIVRRRTASWFDRPVKVSELIATSQPRNISSEAAEKERLTLERYRKARIAANDIGVVALLKGLFFPKACSAIG